jgi:hypothetical protein
MWGDWVQASVVDYFGCSLGAARLSLIDLTQPSQILPLTIVYRQSIVEHLLFLFYLLFRLYLLYPSDGRRSDGLSLGPGLPAIIIIMLSYNNVDI